MIMLRWWVCWSHHGASGGVLAGLVLGSLDPGLQVSRGVEVLALVAAAAALDVVHADDDRVLTAVYHGCLQGMGVAAVTLAPRAVTPLELTTHLEAPERRRRRRGGGVVLM